MSIEMGKDILNKDSDIRLVLIKDNRIIYKSNDRGILPIYKIATKYKKEANNAILVDRVIGRGAALLTAYAGISQVHGELVSEGGKEILAKNNIKYSYDKDTAYIKNRDKTDYCPIEKLSLGIDDGKIMLEKVGDFLENLNK